MHPSYSLWRLISFNCLALVLATSFVSEAYAGRSNGKSWGNKDRSTQQSNTAPTISGVPAASVAEDSAYLFQPSASDADGDSLSFSIQNRPAWASFNSGTGRLSGTPGNNDVGSYDSITITVSDGSASATLGPFSIRVSNTNDAPSISGTPSSSVEAGSFYGFQPVAGDPDGDSLTFSIQNRPAWATFDSSTGRLYGTPGVGDVGDYDSIVLAVSDGQMTTVLPVFSIKVNAVAATGAYDLYVSSSPDRSGATSLDSSSVSGNIYVFTGPDSSVQKVEFFVDNTSAQGGAYQTETRAPYDLAGTASASAAKPFDTTQLTQGIHTVTAKLTLVDGSSQLVSAAFMVAADGNPTDQTGTVSLNWVAPTQRADGSPISVSELAGYTVHYGPSQGSYTNSIGIDDPFTTSVVISDLPVGTYYFALTARDKEGLESGYSGAVSKQAQ